MSRSPHPTVRSTRDEYSILAEQTARSYTDNSKTQHSSTEELRYLLPPSHSPPPYVSPYAPLPERPGQSPSVPILRSQDSPPSGPSVSTSSEVTLSAPMSVYSSSSQDETIYSSPGPRQYRFDSSGTMDRPLSQSEKETLVQSLRTRRVNTLIELRRIERILAMHASPDITGPMTSAWAYYVNSNNLLSELRGLTKSYPFSSECLDEAKWMVIADPESTRSWNYCWLVLVKIRDESLIATHARTQAAKPTMWGGRTPSAANVQQLTAACLNEWTGALDQMLRHWEEPPTTTGN